MEGKEFAVYILKHFLVWYKDSWTLDQIKYIQLMLSSNSCFEFQYMSAFVEKIKKILVSYENLYWNGCIFSDNFRYDIVK